MVLVATQVKRRRGTTAENDAFTGAEGEIVVDTERHELRVHDGVTQGGFKIGGGSGSGRNIGDIFYTTRTDTALSGAVECNGGTYSTADYTGDGSIGELLASGKLPYVSLTDYATQITNNGVCGVFGWDGTGTTTFRVPTLQDVFIECGQASQLGNYIPAGLPNITGNVSISCLWRNSDSNGALSTTGGTKKITYDNRDANGPYIDNLYFDASSSNSIYGNSNTVQPKAIKYRAMVQLATGATDEALETCTSVLADVSGLKDMSNVTATGKNTVVGWGMPDYSAGVSQVEDVEYTAPSAGVLYVQAQDYNTNTYITIDGERMLVQSISSNQASSSVATYLIDKGSTYKVEFGRVITGQYITFYPCKGVN